MFQGTDERLIRAAGRFNWGSDKLRIVAAVIQHGNHPADVAYAEGLSKKRVTNMVGEARSELHAQAILEGVDEAFDVDTRVEMDPVTPDEHAYALSYATGFENEFSECKKAVLLVGAY